MRKKAITGRIRRGRFVLLSLLLIVFFFLPWLRLRYETWSFLSSSMESRQAGNASGLQLAQGTMTTVSHHQTAFLACLRKGQYNEAIKPRPRFYAGLAIPLVLLMMSLLGLKGRLKTGRLGACMLILAIPGVVMMVQVTDVDYAQDFVAKLIQEEPAHRPWVSGSLPPRPRREIEEVIAEDYETRPTFIFWTSLVFYALIAFCGLLNLIISAVPAGHHLRRREKTLPPEP